MSDHSRAKSWLIGCGVTLAIAAVTLSLVLFSGYWWISVPGPQVDTRRFIGPETVGLVDLDHPFEDDGLRQLAVSVNLEANRKQAKNVREFSKPLALLITFFQPERGEVEAKLQSDSPRQVTILLESVDGDDLQPAVIVNFNRFSRLMRLAIDLYGRLSDEDLAYGDFVLIPFEDGQLTFVKDTVVWAGSERALRQILDRVGAAPEGAPDDREEIVEPRWDFLARIENRAGSIAYLTRIWEEKVAETWPTPEGVPIELLDSMRQLEVAVDITSDDSATVSVKAHCKRQPDCRAWKESLQKLWESSKPDLPVKSLRLQEDELAVHSDLELAGFRSQLVDLLSGNPSIEDLLEKARRSRERRQGPRHK